MAPPRPPQRLTPRLPIALAALLTACGTGQEGSPPSAPSLQRPQLEILSSDEGPSLDERVIAIPFPGQVSAWSPVGRTCALEGEGPQRALRVESGEEDLLLKIPGKFKATEFDLVRVRGMFPASYQVTVLLTGGSDYQSPPALLTRNQRGEQTLSFFLPGLVGLKTTYDTLTVHVRGPSEGFELRAIERVRRPRHLFLPTPDEAPVPVQIGNQSRPAVGLVPGRGARFQIQARPGEMFSCAVAMPPHLSPKGGDPRVQVTLQGENGRKETLTARFDLDRPRWTVMKRSLDGWAGSTVEVQFTYECSDANPGVAALAGVQVWRPMEDPPCVLFVSSDTHRADHLGSAHGPVQVATPAIDALAEGGLFFERCWGTTNVTSPSHVAMMTGIHPRDTRLVSNLDRLSNEALTLAETYRDAGWATLAVVSVGHLGPRGTDLSQGFDQMFSPAGEPWSAAKAVNTMEGWIKGSDGRPLFLFLHLFDAHHPYSPPPSHDRLYYPENKDPADPALPPLNVRALSIPADIMGAGIRDLEYPRAQYRAEISYLDGELGRLLAHRRVRSGLVAVTADHGEILEKDGTYFNHGELFPDTLHVPLVLGGEMLPEEFRGRRVARPVDQLGLGRTLLDLSGLQGVEFPGSNLLRESGAEGSGGPALFALSAHGYSASIQRGRWFLLLHLQTHQGTLARLRNRHSIELYDLEQDPECLQDLGSTRFQEAEALRTELIAWLAEATPGGLSKRRQASAQEAAQLQALGYATGAAAVEDEPWYDPHAR